MVKDMRETVIENLRDNVAKEFGEGYMVRHEVVQKNNGVKLQAIAIMREGAKVGPNIYVDDYINDIMEGRRTVAGVTEIVKKLYDEQCEMQGFLTGIESIVNKEYILQHVEYRLVNAELNKSRLADKPKKSLANLSIIYIVVIGEGNEGMTSITLDNSIMERAKISFEELDTAAKSNTEKESLCIKHISEFALEAAENLGVIDSKDIEIVKEEGPNFFVATNDSKVFGARVILHDNMLSNLAERMGGDFYILPSSVHEVMIVPVGEMESWYLKYMLEEANATSVYPKDILSYDIYRYCADTEQIEIVEE